MTNFDENRFIYSKNKFCNEDKQLSKLSIMQFLLADDTSYPYHVIAGFLVSCTCIVFFDL